MVEERKTSSLFRKLKPHEVSDFPLVKTRAAPLEKPYFTVNLASAFTRGLVDIMRKTSHPFSLWEV